MAIPVILAQFIAVTFYLLGVVPLFGIALLGVLKHGESTHPDVTPNNSHAGALELEEADAANNGARFYLRPVWH